LPFRDTALWLRDIADSIEMVEQFTAGMDFESFRGDAKTVAAVERKLLLISEAAVRLGDEAPGLCPGLPWANIRGMKLAATSLRACECRNRVEYR
jgi:uncharacterized protein with HEPN domain